MSKLTPLICPTCGGQIDRATMICHFCGTQFKRDEDALIHIATFRPDMTTLSGSVFVPMELVMGHEEDAMEYALKELSRKLAESIIPFMTVRTAYEPNMNVQKVQGLVRVIHPDARFGDNGFKE